VSGVRFQQLKNHKYQNTNTKRFDKLTTTLSQVEGQITKTDPPQADQTDYPQAFVPNIIITGRQKFGQRYDTTALNVLVIGY
jgi:hypothetical protein